MGQRVSQCEPVLYPVSYALPGEVSILIYLDVLSSKRSQVSNKSTFNRSLSYLRIIDSCVRIQDLWMHIQTFCMRIQDS